MMKKLFYANGETMSSSPTMSLSDMMQQEDQPGPDQYGSDQAGSDVYPQAPPIGQAGARDGDVKKPARAGDGAASLLGRREVQEPHGYCQDDSAKHLGTTDEAG